MPAMQFQTTVERPVEDVFDLLADLKNYPRWLPSGGLYKSVAQISDDPVRLNTTYVDHGSASMLTGRITEFAPPTLLTFRQFSKQRIAGLEGGLEIEIRYTLDAHGTHTHVTRAIVFQVQGVIWLLQPIIANAIRKENERIMATLTNYLNAPSPATT
ncbi:MAG: SRPBCC family protein [Anaerolineae bacterium]|nr:SRPBCC family protein [Anaerolineae bacterium]